jgi:hypothetical protein
MVMKMRISRDRFKELAKEILITDYLYVKALWAITDPEKYSEREILLMLNHLKENYENY